MLNVTEAYETLDPTDRAIIRSTLPVAATIALLHSARLQLVVAKGEYQVSLVDPEASIKDLYRLDTHIAVIDSLVELISSIHSPES